jgi:hypothetical protein
LEDRNGLTAKQRDDAEVLKSKYAEFVEVQVSCDEALVDVVEARLVVMKHLSIWLKRPSLRMTTL